jgi:hypothetical protein
VQIQDVVIDWLTPSVLGALSSVEDPASPPHLTVREQLLDLGVVLHHSVEGLQGFGAASLAGHA